MAISAQELNIILTARDKQFQKAMTAAEAKVGKFSKASQANLSKVSQSYSALGAAAKRLGPALAAAFSVRALVNMTNSAVELGNLAAVAGVSVERFQELAFAGAAFGVSQEKMADILKDVNDKFGDYLTTGAGPLADFFENIAPKIGLTTKAFEGLSSDQKMGKYIQALQEANLSQDRMTFFMEALASDSTLLIGAFKDGGAELDRLSGKLRNAGGVMSSEMIEKSRAAQEELRLVSEVLSKNLSAGLELVLPLITRLTRDFDNLTTAVGNYFSSSKEISSDTVFKALLAQLGQITEINGKISELDLSITKSNETSFRKRIAFHREQAKLLQAEIDAKFLYLDSLKPGNDALVLPPVVVTADNPTGPTNAKTREAAEAAAVKRKAALLAGNITVLQDYTDALIAGETAAADMAADTVERLAEAQAAYDSVRGSLEPLYAATQDYGRSIRDVNAALAEGFISEEQAAKDRERLVQNFQAIQDEASGLTESLDVVGDAFATAFGDIISGTSSVSDAFKRMAASIITDLIKIQFQQAQKSGGGGSGLGGLGESLFSGLASLLGGGTPGYGASAALGASGSGVMASGGFVPFIGPGMASGGAMAAGSPAVVGEHGREIFVPSSAGRMLSVPQSKAAVNGGGGATVNQTINVTTGIQQTVRAEIQSLMPQIAAASTQAVLNARRRGGSFARSFS